MPINYCIDKKIRESQSRFKVSNTIENEVLDKFKNHQKIIKKGGRGVCVCVCVGGGERVIPLYP